MYVLVVKNQVNFVKIYFLHILKSTK